MACQLMKAFELQADAESLMVAVKNPFSSKECN
jgi:hypothetical protein